ncbi:acyl-CoA dehydrogenase family protein, partial [uncultured Deinococcus sp.]
PNVALKVIDRAIQVYGGEGVSQDTPLAMMYAQARTLRLADGPDIVHVGTVAKEELRRQGVDLRAARPRPDAAPKGGN